MKVWKDDFPLANRWFSGEPAVHLGPPQGPLYGELRLSENLPVLGDALATLELFLHVRNEEVDARNWKFIPVEQDEPRVT